YPLKKRKTDNAKRTTGRARRERSSQWRRDREAGIRLDTRSASAKMLATDRSALRNGCGGTAGAVATNGLQTMNTSSTWLSGPARFDAKETKAICTPSPVMAGATSGVPLLPSSPSSLTSTARVVCRIRSRTKTLAVKLVSYGARLEASEPKATKRPAGLTLGGNEASVESPPGRWPAQR